MGTAHNSAKRGDIAETVLLPGDPLRAKFIAENYLTDVVCYNKVRNMLGYTGRYEGYRVSVQGTGMGIPSISICLNELINEYGCQNLIRVGTAGAIQPDIKLGELVMGMTAAHDSATNRIRFNGMTYCPTADFGLLLGAYNIAKKKAVKVHVGQILATDTFYNDDMDEFRIWAAHGVVALDMEAAALYTLAAKYGRKALCINTVSDSLITHEAMSSEEREFIAPETVAIAIGAAFPQRV